MTIPITYRSVKGANLTANEVDANFEGLADAIQDLIDNPLAGVSVVGFTVTGTTFLVNLSDGSHAGPYNLPLASWRWRGEWTPGTLYQVNDTFSVAETGIFLTLQAHTSATDFDPDASNTEGPELTELLGIAPPAQVDVLNYTDTHTITAAEAGAYLRFDKATAVLCSIPLHADVPVPVGSVYSVRQVGAGSITFDPLDTSIVIHTPETLVTRKTGSTATLINVGADEWDLAGDLELA